MATRLTAGCFLSCRQPNTTSEVRESSDVMSLMSRLCSPRGTRDRFFTLRSKLFVELAVQASSPEQICEPSDPGHRKSFLRQFKDALDSADNRCPADFFGCELLAALRSQFVDA